MSQDYTKGPCLCGAPDCEKCFPQNFANGRYKYVECSDCGTEILRDDEGDGLCDLCHGLLAEKQE